MDNPSDGVIDDIIRDDAVASTLYGKSLDSVYSAKFSLSHDLYEKQFIKE